ncbi:MAG: hypothetical protein H0V70_18670 [Ktedonobacteraceae bacterium]|nr:hypothetical protein [Ktedonobacteraceae bacterium]
MASKINTTQLEYRDRLWQGEDGTLFVRMDHVTFNQYVQRYILTCYGSDEPTVEQRGAAIAHCRALSYWHGVTDPEIRIGYKGGHKP